VLVQVSRGVVFLAGRTAKEVERLAADGEQERRRKRGVGLDVERANVFHENRRGRPDLLAMVDEPGVDVVGRMVIDHDVDGGPLGNRVVRARNRMIDERE
jgi:hypothetical protein